MHVKYFTIAFYRVNLTILKPNGLSSVMLNTFLMPDVK